MPETTTSNNSKELILPPVNSILTLSTESEIIFTSACASHLLVRNSEIVSENSLLCSMNAQLIGSCHGPKRHLFQSQSHSSKSSKNLILKKIQKFNSWSIWVTSITWSLTFVMSISREWEDKSISLLNLIWVIWQLTRNYILSNTRNSMFKSPTLKSVWKRSTKPQKLLQEWRLSFHRKS